jgi:hypothetical protein
MHPKIRLSRAFAWLSFVLVAVIAVSVALAAHARANPSPTRQVPQFAVDPSWEKLPSKWYLGPAEGVTVDAHDHIWALHRPIGATPVPGREAAPPVLEFDKDGSFIQAWGGPGQGFEWPGAEHGIFIDYKGYLWITGSGTDPKAGNDQIVKFTQAGKFVMQIGHRGQGKGNADQENMRGPSVAVVYAKTNEVFVADGFFNRRVIVFDADTGAFKRMWGAFGNAPTDPTATDVPYRASDGAVHVAAQDNQGDGPAQFSNVHGLGVSNDGLVYVCDKGNRRIQIFTVAGKYVNQVFISRDDPPPSTLTGMAFGKPRRELADKAAQSPTSASSVAFSPDREQRFLYVADRRTAQVQIYDRKSLEYLGAFGDGPGEAPGQLYQVHGIAVDSKGNVYTTEESDSPANNRVQKWELQGMSPAARN